MIREIQNGKIKWIDIIAPDKDSEKFLEEEYEIAPSIIKEYIPPVKRPKVEDYREYLFAVIHFPIFNYETKKISSIELDVILFKNVLITSHSNGFPNLKKVFEHCQDDIMVKNYYMENDAVCLIYRLLDKLIDTQMPMIDHIEDHIEKLEKEMFQQNEKKLLKEIAVVKHDIIGFRKTIKPQRTVLESLALATPKLSKINYNREIKEVIGSNIKIWNTLENNKEMIEALEQSNEALFSHRLNDTMRILTAFSVMMLPLSLVANAFGMNIEGGMPLADSPFGFWVVVMMMLIVTLTAFIFFKYKKWM